MLLLAFSEGEILVRSNLMQKEASPAERGPVAIVRLYFMLSIQRTSPDNAFVQTLLALRTY